jgi:hypothetical protein
LDAIDEGRDPLEDLQKFVTMSFLDGNNNGVPQNLAGYQEA